MTIVRRAPVVLLVILVAACTGRQGGSSVTGGDAFRAYAETDFAQAPDQVYAEAAQALSRATGRDLSDLPGARAYGPKDVVPVRGGHLLVAAEPAEDAELLVLALAGDQGPAWVRDLPLASGTLVTGATVLDRDGAQLVRLALSGGAADAIYLALGPEGPVLVRAESGGRVANAAFRRANPRVATSPGKLGDEDPIRQLAATVHLAGIDQAEARGRSAVQGHLKALAGSTDTWLAEAAANLLTMPTQ